MKSFEEMKTFLKEKNATHLLNFYDELSENEQKILLEQIEKIDFDYMQNLYQMTKESNAFQSENREITPITALDKSKLSTEEYTSFNELGKKLIKEGIGKKLIKEGKLAVCSMAGGQGTRLRL